MEAGERATVTAGAAQTAALAADENLTVNGVTIAITAGPTQADVVARINEFSPQTGVTAEISAGSTRLYSDAFGSSASVSVISNVAAAATSTGFGTTEVTDTGVDIIADIGGTSFTGQGNVVTATSGSTKGLTLQLAVDPANATATVTGAQGNVTVVDNSLVFQIGPNQNQTASVTVDRINASALGISVSGNQLNNLSEISVTSASKSQDAIGVIDAAIADATNPRGTLGAFQKNGLETTANNLRATLENTVNAESVIRDTDFAAETAELTRAQILVNASTQALGIANVRPQAVLSLLG